MIKDRYIKKSIYVLKYLEVKLLLTNFSHKALENNNIC